MPDRDVEGAVLHAEPGAGWWPLLWGPGFAAVGLGVELATSGPVHVLVWPVLALLLSVAAALWVLARRRFLAVRLTTDSLTVGGEVVPVRLVEPAEEGDVPGNARVLGGGRTVPKGTGGVPVRVRGRGAAPGQDEEVAEVVLAWARHPDALTAALREVRDRS